MILFSWGEEYVPIEKIATGFAFNEQAHSLGFQDGDIPIRADKQLFTRFDSSQSISDVYRGISKARECEVLRDGKSVVLQLPGNINMLEMMQNDPPFISVLSPSKIDSVLKDSPAEKTGMRAGDQIVAFNGKDISSWNQFQDATARIVDALSDMTTRADSLTLLNVNIAVKHTDDSVDTNSYCQT